LKKVVNQCESIMRNYPLKCFAQLLVFMIVLSGCTNQNLIEGYGELKGKITIGPICPVETIPPNPQCLPTADTYKAWATAVWTLNRKSKVAVLNPNLDGTYEMSIPAGSYIIDFDQNNIFHAVGSNLPALITIALGDTTKFNVNIDTGIR
jgi:hypothetical protein